MRSLFIRIFLWFWAATVLLDAVLIGTIFVTEPEPQPAHWRTLTRSFLELYGRDAAAAYELNGCAGLNGFLTRADPFTGVHQISVLADNAGNGLCGAALNGKLTEAARHVHTAPALPAPRLPLGILRWPTADRAPLRATAVAGPSGKRYVLLFDLPRLRPQGASVPLETWALRAFALLVTAGLVCYGLARYFTSPLRRLRTVARRFADGDLTARVAPDGLLKRRDELAELGRDFDDMAGHIETLVKRQDELLKSQRRLLGDISHELRSPLTRLALASGLLQRKLGDDAKPLLSRIDRESERLNVLIGQLLTLTRLDAIPAPEAMEKVDLNVLLQDIVNDAAFEAMARNVQIEFSASDFCVLHGIRDLLRSAFENVLRNALRYTAEGTSVAVELECTRKLISVTVSDHGPGVPEKDLVHLFEPFYRVAEARDRLSGGIGLGLAIAERTVRLHSGTVAALNRPKGGLSVCMTFSPGAVPASPVQAILNEAVL